MEPKSGPLTHWSWPFSSGAAGTHPFCTPLNGEENVVTPQCQHCCSSVRAGSNLSPPPPSKVQLWFYYSCWKNSPGSHSPSKKPTFQVCSSRPSTVWPQLHPYPILSCSPWDALGTQALLPFRARATCGSTSIHLLMQYPPLPLQKCPFFFYPTFISFLATHTTSLRITFSENCPPIKGGPWPLFLPLISHKSSLRALLRNHFCNF